VESSKAREESEVGASKGRRDEEDVGERVGQGGGKNGGRKEGRIVIK
jgi:hypothetical protein